jgi:hypothetical protein
MWMGQFMDAQRDDQAGHRGKKRHGVKASRASGLREELLGIQFWKPRSSILFGLVEAPSL